MTQQPTTRQPLTEQQLDLDLIEQRAAHLYEYEDLPDDAEILTGTEVPALLAQVRRLQQPRRTLTPAEYTAAWHAIEGAAGEPGADPGTILAAVLDALGTATPDAEITDRPSRPAQSSRPCGHDDYHNGHPWADQPHRWCPGHGYDSSPA